MRMPAPRDRHRSARAAGIGASAKGACVVTAIALPQLPIPAARLLRLAGYRDAAAVRAQLRSAAEAVTALAAEVAAPAVCYRRVRVRRCTADGLVLAGGTAFSGPLFAAHLAGSREVVAFVLSLGSRFDDTQAELVREARGLEAYLMELAGWLCVEQATRQFRDRLARESAPENLRLTPRLAPGYALRVAARRAEWPLEDQRLLFALFEGATLPARLLAESCAMTPKMSRSGLYGLCTANSRTT